MSRILLTGGAGFIGSHVCEAYIKDGHEVLVLDDLSSGNVANLKTVEGHPSYSFVQGDIRDATLMASIIDRYKPEVVNLHAAQKSVPESMANPRVDIDINLIGLINILECINGSSVKNVISVSSGGALAGPLMEGESSSESSTPSLESPYAITKFAGEHYVRVFSKRLSYEYTLLRYSNVYGPRQIPDGECGVIPIFTSNLVAGRPSFLNAYPDMPRGCTRDYVHVVDVAQANLLALSHPINRAINIGSGNEYAIADIYDLLARAFGSDQPLVRKGPRAGDIRRSVLDCTLALSLWKWHPSISLEEGLVQLAGQSDPCNNCQSYSS